MFVETKAPALRTKRVITDSTLQTLVHRKNKECTAIQLYCKCPPVLPLLSYDPPNALGSIPLYLQRRPYHRAFAGPHRCWRVNKTGRDVGPPSLEWDFLVKLPGAINKDELVSSTAYKKMRWFSWRGSTPQRPCTAYRGFACSKCSLRAARGKNTRWEAKGEAPKEAGRRVDEREQMKTTRHQVL